MKATARSAYITVTKNLKRVSKTGDAKAFYAYISSEAYRVAYGALDAVDRVAVAKAQFAAQLSCETKKPIPPRWSMRVRWTEEKIAALKAADRRYGTDEGIAREMSIPIKNARRARLRYLGPRNRAVAHATAA